MKQLMNYVFYHKEKTEIFLKDGMFTELNVTRSVPFTPVIHACMPKEKNQ